jgi:hypothetical protein
MDDLKSRPLAGEIGASFEMKGGKIVKEIADEMFRKEKGAPNDMDAIPGRISGSPVPVRAGKPPEPQLATCLSASSVETLQRFLFGASAPDVALLRQVMTIDTAP